MRQRCLFFEQHCGGGGGGSVYISKNLSCHLMGSRRLSSFLLSSCKVLYCVISSLKFTVPCLRVLGCPFRFSSCSGRTVVGGSETLIANLSCLHCLHCSCSGASIVSNKFSLGVFVSLFCENLFYLLGNGYV